jgi:CubicO group peptidase (beta-lactamase class C family)
MKKFILYTIAFTFVSACSTTEKQDLAALESQKKEDLKKIRDEKNKTLDKKIEQIAKDFNLPALHVQIHERGDLAYQKFQGVRAVGTSSDKTTPTSEKDRFYLGHHSKILTSLLVAQLIDLKVINWNSTLAQLVGKDFQLNPQLAGVTVEMLMAQRSGLVGLEKLKVMSTLDKYSTRRGRELVVQSALSYNPDFTPDSKMAVNSTNHVVLGWILEKYTNFQWEELVKNKVFYDVGLTQCGFGLATNPKSQAIDHPLGHTLSNFKLVSEKNIDVPAAIAPAESLNCSAEDLAKLLKEISMGLYRESQFLKEETFLKVFGPSQDPKMTYAHFLVHDRVWAGGRTLTASSLDTYFTSHMVLAPAREIVIIVMTNSGTPKAREGSAKILKLLTESVQ